MSFVLRPGVMESSGTNAIAVNLGDCPAGAIRLMMNDIGQIPGRGARTVAAWNAGLWPIPCLKTQAVGTAAAYRTQMTNLLDIVAPVGGPRKTDVIEVGNEPGQGTYPPGTDLAFYLDCLKNSYDLIRARGCKVVLAAMTQGASYTTGGTRYNGSVAVSRAITNGYRGVTWQMLDGFALHQYQDSVPGLVSTFTSQRTMFPADKFMLITENGWPSGTGGPFTQNYSESMRINRILDMWANVSSRAEAWNLWCWSWFIYSDFATTSNYDNRCGLVKSASAGGARKEMPTGSVTRPAGSFGAGESFTQSWEAMDFIPKSTTIETGGPPPPPPPPDPDPPPPDPEFAVQAAPPDPPPLRLLEAVGKAHTLAVKVEVLREGEVIATPVLIGGSVTFDSKASVRATCDLTLPPEWIPESDTDPVTPYGNEVRVYRGVHYGVGDEELVSLGIFRIDTVEVEDSGEGLEVRVSGSDRSATVSDAKFETPHSVPRGTKFTTAISDVIDAALNFPIQTRFIEIDITTPALIAEEGEDRWEFASGLAQVLKAELYFDSNGVLVLAPIPESTDDPVLELVEGEDGVLLEASKRWSAEGAFNVVIVTAENSDVNPPIRSTLPDTNPDSPTRIDGPFGVRTRFYSNQFITTQGQADNTAEGILAQELGTTQQIDFGAVTNPTLRASDVVSIRRDRISVSGAHIIDSLTIPLDAESSMTGTTRLVRPQVLEAPRAAHLIIGPDLIVGSELVIF